MTHVVDQGRLFAADNPARSRQNACAQMTRGWDLRGPAKDPRAGKTEGRARVQVLSVYCPHLPRGSLTCATPRTRVLHGPDSWRRLHFAVSRLKDREYTEGYESQRHWREQKPAERLSQDRLHRAVQALGFLRVEVQRRIAEQARPPGPGPLLWLCIRLGPVSPRPFGRRGTSRKYRSRRRRISSRP